MRQQRDSQRNLLAITFIGVTILTFAIYFSWHWTQESQEGIVSEQLIVARLNEQVAAQARLIALEPEVNAALAQATRKITPELLVREHQSIDACADNSRVLLTKYNLVTSTATMTITLTGAQNGTLRFLDCLDRLELPITPSTLTFTPGGKGAVLTTYIGTLVHA